MTPRLWQATSPADMATLPPGHYYWMTGFSGRGVPEIVSVYRGSKGRVITNGCEYTQWNFGECIEQARHHGGLDKINFWGPIPTPEELK